MDEGKKKKRLLWIGVVLTISCVLLVGATICSYFEKNKKDDVFAENLYITEETEVEIEAIIEEKGPEKIRLMMLGDNLMHMGVVRKGIQSDGSRNYDFLFEPLIEYLEYADIKMVNQETILGGNHLGFSGFPYFNSPTEVGDAIVKAGFNVVLQASNHSADQGISGINHCIDFWEQYPQVLMTGIYKNVDEENQDIALLTVGEVTFAILNYTYSPNLATLPKDIQGHLGMLCNWDKGTGRIDFTMLHPDVLTDIATAEQMADIVIVCPHWGTEYTFVPSSYQQKFAMQMTEAGADLIIGTHPHVIQPVEWIESGNGNRALCYYSLGNYVSTQQDEESMLEAMAWVTFVIREDSVEILEEETGALPMVCHYTSGPVRHERVYFLEEYTQEQAKVHGIHAFGGNDFKLENLELWAREVFGEWQLSSNDVFKDRIDAQYLK